MSALFQIAPLAKADAVGRIRPIGGTLAWSDLVTITSLWLALFVCADPFNLGLRDFAGTRHTPLMLAVAGLMLATLGHALNPRQKTSNDKPWLLIRSAFPLALLGIWALAGGTEARLVDGIQDTFLITGLYMLAAFVIAKSVMLCNNHERLISFVCRSIAVVAAFMIIRMLVRREWTGGIYHELEFLVVPVAVFFALRRSRHPTLDKWMAVFFLAGGIVFMKNTGYIALVITLAYLFFVDWRFDLHDRQRLYRWLVLGLTGLAVALAAISVLGSLAPEIALPSGNTGYRIRTYDRAIARFAESPIWGTLFAERSTARFVAYNIPVAGGQLPTHSDTLDIAANGGVIGLALLAWTYVRLGRLAQRTLFRARPTAELQAGAHMFACMSIVGASVYTFNPIMLQPDKAMLLWSSLGILLGCCLHRDAAVAQDGESKS